MTYAWHTLRAQAHFTAPSSERRKLMSAPLSGELRTKYQASPPRRKPLCTLIAGWRTFSGHNPSTTPTPAHRA